MAREFIEVEEARAFAEANYQGDPLIKHMFKTLLDKLPRVEAVEVEKGKTMKIEARPWKPQDLLDDLQGIIDEESDNYLNTRRTTLETALAYLKEYFAKDTSVPSKNVGEWIPVSERLPNICETVLVCFDFMGAKAFRVSDRYGKNGMLWAGLPSNSEVTHWMPLPEPPKEEN